MEFLDVANWVTPATQSVTIVQESTTSATGTYVRATRRLTFSTDGTAGASLSGPTPQDVTIGSNSLPVTAQAPGSHHFAQWTWTGVVFSVANSLVVSNVAEDMDLVANFDINRYAVRFETDGTAGAVLVGDTNQLVAYGSNSTPVRVDYPVSADYRRWVVGGPTGPSYSTNNPVTATNVTGDIVLVAKFGTRFHVRADAGAGGDGRSWAGAFRTLPEATALAGADDEVWVAKGVYYPTEDATNRTAAFPLNDGLGIYGGFAGVETQRVARNWHTNVSVLSGDLDRDDVTDRDGISWSATDTRGSNALHVVVASNVSSSAVLDGFFITGGRADGIPHRDGSGGGLLCVSGDGVALRHVTFAGNYAKSWGGGVYLVQSDACFVNCAFVGNESHGLGGGVAVDDASPRFTDNTNGTVTDNLTGLIWLKDIGAFGDRNWTNGLNDCATLNTGEHGLSDGSAQGDWRLPNVRELFTIADFGQSIPALPPGHPFTNYISWPEYWSSTTDDSNKTYAWGVNLDFGWAEQVTKASTRIVWPVRGGE